MYKILLFTLLSFPLFSQSVPTNVGIGDPTTPTIHVFADSVRMISYSTTFSKYLRVVDNEYLYEEGDYTFTHNIKEELFTVSYCGEDYLNFHAKLFAKDKTRALYMVNPHTYVEYNEDFLRFYSDAEDTLIYFYK